MNDKVILLLDVDHTLIDPGYGPSNDFGELDTLRPYLKEFMTEVLSKYYVRFYTAANRDKITNMCRHLIKCGIDDRLLIFKLQKESLHRQNCPEVENNHGYSIKSLENAASKLGVDAANIILVDDNLYREDDHPQFNQIINAKAYYKDFEDDYLLKLPQIIEDKIKELGL